MICRSFEPIAAKDARVLIVGSMPSVKSLEQQEYYAHPRNAFWPILFDVFGVRMDTAREGYAQKKALILANHLTLWDAASVCEREGSLDSEMRDVQYNDFSQLYVRCPKIRTVLCNGGTAHTLFLRSGAGVGKNVVRLPSTSPAYTLPYAKKKEAWRAALMQALDETV